MTDTFSAYERGLADLLARLGRDHPRYAEVLILQQRLVENITRSQQHGDTETRRAERSEVVRRLNELALAVLGVPFNELCGLEALEAAGPGGATPVPGSPAGSKYDIRIEHAVGVAIGDWAQVIVAPPPPATPPDHPFLVAFPPNPDFVGREEDLARLHEMVHQGGAPVGIRPTVLVGLGGIGKTQLAVQYAHLRRDDYAGGVFWLNAANPLLQEFAGMAEQLGLADRETPRERAAFLFWTYLDKHPDSLVIFDNVVEPSSLNVPFAPNLVPANLRCRTLFTTRQRDFPRNFRPFEVKVLPEEAAMRLLLRSRPEVLEERYPERSAAQAICASLGWLPLALELAAGYLGAYSGVTLAGYLERLRVEGNLTTVDDTELHAEDLPTRHQAAVAAALRTQWARLDEEADQDARLLFRAAGQFPPAAWIPIARLGLLTGIAAEAIPGHPPPLAQALKKLDAISLVEELTGDRLRLHPLVQEFAVGLSPFSFRVEMAAHLAAALSDVRELETQVVGRGIDTVIEDLRTGLGLCQGTKKSDAAYARLSRLERVLDREAHNLREWDPATFPAYFLQQVYIRARILEFTGLAAAAEAELIKQRHPHLQLQWRTSHESVALLRILAGRTGNVTAVAVTADGRAVSGSGDCTLQVWDLETGQCLHALPAHTWWVTAVAVTADGRQAVSGSDDDGTLRVWNLETGQCLRTLEGHTDQVTAVAVTPDGRAVSGSWDRTLRVWDLATGQCLRTLEGHTKDVAAVAVTVDGCRAVSGSDDRTLRVWDLETEQEMRRLEGRTGWGLAVAMTADGCRAVSAGSHNYTLTLRVWDLETGQCLHTLEGHTGDVRAVAVTPDGCKVVSAGSYDHALRVWDLETGQCLHTMEGHTGDVRAVAVTPDGRRVVSGAGDHTLRVWNLETGQSLLTLEVQTGLVEAMAVTPDGRRAVSGSDDGTLRVWDLETGQQIRRLEGHIQWVKAVAVTPDGRRAVSGSWDRTLRVWDLETGQEVRTLEGHTGMVTTVAVTADGRVVSGSDDGTLRVWDLETGREVTCFSGEAAVYAIALTPDGRGIVAVDRLDNVYYLCYIEPDAP